MISVAVVLAWNGRRHLFWIGLAAALLEFSPALDLYRSCDQGVAAMQFAERLSLVGPLEYHAAADGLTVLFVLLNALLTMMIVIYSAACGLQPLLLVIVFSAVWCVSIRRGGELPVRPGWPGWVPINAIGCRIVCVAHMIISKSANNHTDS